MSLSTTFDNFITSREGIKLLFYIKKIRISFRQNFNKNTFNHPILFHHNLQSNQKKTFSRPFWTVWKN